MKKFLFILIIFTLSISSSFAKDPPKKYLDESYIFKNQQIISWPEKIGIWENIETHGRISQNSWNLRYEKEIVRDGKYSLRFEMRDGDCHQRDCERDNKAGRSEVSFQGDYPKSSKGHVGNIWYAWSMYIPEGTDHMRPAYTILGQFKMPSAYTEQLNRVNSSGFDEDCPEIPILFKLEKEGLTLVKDGVLQCEDHERKIILPHKTIHNKWHDFLLNVNWTDKDDGHVDLWINNKKVYHSTGKTIGKLLRRNKDGKKMGPNFRFGIYNGKRISPVKTQIVYYDSFKSGKNCMKTSLFHDCKNLPEE